LQLATCYPSTSAAWADALFASVLQHSDKPDPGPVRKAIAAAACAYGGGGCAQRVAQEFGDHPETAVTRMRWARAVAGEVFDSPPVLREAAPEDGRDNPLPALGHGDW
jgi:hypothetical protein